MHIALRDKLILPLTLLLLAACDPQTCEPMKQSDLQQLPITANPMEQVEQTKKALDEHAREVEQSVDARLRGDQPPQKREAVWRGPAESDPDSTWKKAGKGSWSGPGAGK